MMGRTFNPTAQALQPESIAQLIVDAFKSFLKSKGRPDLYGDVDYHFRRLNESLLAMFTPVVSAALSGDDLPELEATDLWTATQRTKANLEAMQIAASKAPSEMTKADLTKLALYSGWGGLSIKKVKSKFPKDFPQPEERGLIHEYYTPTHVVREVARVIRPLISTLPKRDGRVLALEPSAGIGRFLQATRGPGFRSLKWDVVEWSALSSQMLRAMRPDLDVFEGPFERWVREHEDTHAGNIGLVLSNPPYGPRGASITEDPKRSYREKKAYAYFLRRCLDLLAPGGLGVFLVPAGFVTGTGDQARGLRETILKRHHLSAAYRLPSGIFPGAMLVIDLLFFRARGMELGAVHPDDQFVLDGKYFESYPENILGEEIGKDGGEDDQTKKPRWGYQVVGDFEGLPAFKERKIPAEAHVEDSTDLTVKAKKPSKAKSTGVSRAKKPSKAKGLNEEESLAVDLGWRVDRYLAAVSAQANDEHVQLWPELVPALQAWVTLYGNPHAHMGLKTLAKKGNTAIERLLSAYTKTGTLIPGILERPSWNPRFTGNIQDVPAVAEWAYRNHKELPVPRLTQMNDNLAPSEQLSALFSAGWCIDWMGDIRSSMLYPEKEYLSGDLWPRYDRCKSALEGEHPPRESMVPKEVLKRQRQKLLKAINPAVFEDIEGVSPRQGWLPLGLVSQWINETYKGRVWDNDITLERKEGLVVVASIDGDANDLGTNYEDLANVDKDSYIYTTIRPLLGWINHDLSFFRVKKRNDEDLSEKRMEQAREWERSFRSWLAANEDRKLAIENAYNRHFKGFVTPEYGKEPIKMARWVQGDIQLHPYQAAGARRLLANRGGMLAFDVGLGKSFTGCAVVARARQEGWCKRPVVLVPNSLAWKWAKDFERVLPDYRIGVIGSKKKTVTRGKDKGKISSETDTPEERAAKWTRFQAGEFDVVILTYTSLSRTRMNETALREYADSVEAIKREIALSQRNAKNKKGELSERQEAVLKEGVAAWVAEKVELPESWDYDPGIAWDDLGIDLLVVDEAQNFKNLYMPEQREGGVPRFMGNAGAGSNRAWQLDFRCAAIRRHTGGTGIVLLSATPAKNSPLEFYNLLQLIDPQVWTRLGIRDPEQFIDRYLRIELKQVLGTNMEVSSRSAVVGFTNLHELRDVIFRYAEFKTADDVGLELPEPTVQVIEVDMDRDQEAKYEEYVAEIEAAMESEDPAEKGQILGLLARMSLVSIHANLDEKYDWKTAKQAAEDGTVDPESPKFKALAKNIAAAQHCGHIVFVENVAAHQWIVKVLTDKGIPEKRIAVLNAKTAKQTAKRQQIAQDFNGTDTTPPKYDVVIANQIAYEGVDLQRRTCEIHHIDLPWEPATLQQRNGRGVRQGNTLDAIAIRYYFARRSQDGMRFNLIQGKRGWMVGLIESQDRDTNNPGAQMEMGQDEVLLMISRDPEKTKALLDELKEKREAERKAKVRAAASKLVLIANSRFRRAERKEGEEAVQLRAEGEEVLKDLADFDPDDWPWFKWAVNLREQPVLVDREGSPVVFEGLRVRIRKGDQECFGEFGRIVGDKIGFRLSGHSHFQQFTTQFDEFKAFEPSDFDVPMPDDDLKQAVEGLSHWKFTGGLTREGVTAKDVRWDLAGDAFLKRVWELAGEAILNLFVARDGYYAAQYQKVPSVKGGKLHIVHGKEVLANRVIPFGLDGWMEFLQLAPHSGMKRQEIVKVADFWWGRRLPPRFKMAADKGE